MTWELPLEGPPPEAGDTQAVTAAERRDRLRLARSENVGPATYRKLMEAYGTADRALAELPELARRGGRRKPIRICAKGQAEDELARLEGLGACLLTLGEPDYPSLLTHADAAPPVFAVLGHPHLLKRETVAMVGARNASAGGRRLARDLAERLASAGLLVVSGMARGIDTAAHEGALPHGTAAVLAGGPDVVYPPENRGLYEQICATGAVLSEMAPGTEPLARHFPRRNRIIAGLALGTLVVEATARSGSLITARLALENGREVFAVPGSPLDARARGPNSLLRQGATLTETADDVLGGLEPLRRRPLTERGAAATLPRPAVEIDEEELARGRDAVLQAVGPAPVTVDEVLRECQLSPAVLATVLLELELAGRLERQSGNKVALA